MTFKVFLLFNLYFFFLQPFLCGTKNNEVTFSTNEELSEEELKREQLLNKWLLSDRYFTCFISAKMSPRVIFALSPCGNYLAGNKLLSDEWGIVNIQNERSFSEILDSNIFRSSHKDMLLFPSYENLNRCYYLTSSDDTIMPNEDGESLIENQEIIHVWDAQSKEKIYSLPSLESPITTIIFSPNSQILAYGSQDGSLALYENLTMEPFLLQTFDGCIRKLIFSQNGLYLVVQHGKNHVSIIDVNSRDIIYTKTEPYHIKCIHLNSKYPLLAIELYLSNCVQIINFLEKEEDKQLLFRRGDYLNEDIEKSESSIRCEKACFTPLFKQCIPKENRSDHDSDGENTHEECNIAKKKWLPNKGHSYCAFSPDGELFATWFTDPDFQRLSIVTVYNAKNCALKLKKWVLGEVEAATFSQDSHYVICSLCFCQRTYIIDLENLIFHDWYSQEDEKGKDISLKACNISCSPHLDYIFIGSNNNQFRLMRSFKSLSTEELQKRTRWTNLFSCSVM